MEPHQRQHQQQHYTSRFSEAGTPRFTEHFNASPPYESTYSSYGTDTSTFPTHNSHPSDGTDTYRGLLGKDRRMDPELMNGGLEAVVAPPEEDKEVAFISPQPDFQHNYDPSAKPRRRRICGMSMAVFGTLIAALIIALAIGLGVGLGIGLRDRNKGSSNTPIGHTDDQYTIGGAIDPSYFSTQGAFNGSGIALASQSFTSRLEDGTRGTSVIYFQHYTGTIRWVQLSNSGDWLGGSQSEVVTSNAKNGTPLSAVSHSLNGTSTWHVFFVDKDNYIRQRSQSNTSTVWSDGPINSLNLKALDADQVGLQACWYGSDYGDSDYKHSPLPGPNNGTILPGDQGIWIWYAESNNTFQQYGWRPGDTNWTHQETWNNKNGHAGVACYTWDPYNSTRYAMFVNEQNAVEVYWRDSNTNLTNSTTHPINSWTKSQVSIPNVQPATSLGYTNFLYAQDATTNLFRGYNISWNSENTSIVGDNFTVGTTPGVPGTHLTVSTLPTSSGGNLIVTFYQANGSDISEFTRDALAGQWSSSTISIPSQ